MASGDTQISLIAGLLVDWKVLLGFLAVFVAYSARSFYRLSHVPGPLFQSLSSLGFLKTHLDGSPHIEILKWTQKYGELRPGALSTPTDRGE